MSKGNGSEPFFRKSKGAWYLHWGGRMVSLGKDKDAAFKKWLDMRAQPAPIAPCRTVSALIDQYNEYAERRYRRKDGSGITGEVGVIKLALRRFGEQFGDVKPEALSPDHLLYFQRKLVADDLSRSSILHYLDRVRRMVRWAAGQRIIPKTVEAQFVAPDKGLEDGIALPGRDPLRNNARLFSRFWFDATRCWFVSSSFSRTR